MHLSLHLGPFRLALGSQPGTRNSQLGTLHRSSPATAWLRGDDCTNTISLTSPYQQSVWVYTAISALAQTVSAIPFRISRGDRSGENVLRRGPVVDLFDRPHPYLNRFRFWEFIVTWYCLRGEAFLVALDKSGAVLPVRTLQSIRPSSVAFNLDNTLNQGLLRRVDNPHSAIRNLLVLNPDQFRHVIHHHDLAGWQFTSSRLAGPLPSMAFLPHEVIHDFLRNPYLFCRGLSPL